jgi:hypothetical protein
MNLSAPVTINFPDVTMPDGTVRTVPDRTFNALYVTIMDCAVARTVSAHIPPFTLKSLMLWEGDAYDAAGDYTQAQVDARLREVLGPDIKAGLEALLTRSGQ